MANVEDRWFTEAKNAAGEVIRILTVRHGIGKRWRVRYRTPAGDGRNKSFARKADADRFLINTESSKMDGTFVDPVRAKITIGEMAARWMASKRGLEKSTQSTYRNVMEDHVLPRWKSVSLAAVDFEDVQAWVAELVGAGHSGAHVRKIHFVLAGVLQLAVKGHRLPANPAKGVELPRAKSNGKKYLTVQQVETMAEAAGAIPAGAPPSVNLPRPPPIPPGRVPPGLLRSAVVGDHGDAGALRRPGAQTHAHQGGGRRNRRSRPLGAPPRVTRPGGFRSPPSWPTNLAIISPTRCQMISSSPPPKATS